MAKKIAGRIFGKNLAEVTFVYDSIQPDGTPTPIELGQMLVIEDPIDNNRYIVRVTDIEYGQSVDWSRTIARDLNELYGEDFSSEHENPDDIYSADMRTQQFLQAVCEPLGIIGKNGNFVSPKRLPSYFSPVHKLTEEDLGEDLKSKVGDLPIGRLRSGSDILNIPAGMFKKLLPYHIGVFAQTGGGKSNTMKVLLGAIMETLGEAGSLIFEPHGEYIQDLKRHPLAKDQLITFGQHVKKGESVRKIRVSYDDINVNSLMNVKDQLHWTDAQERFLREASYNHDDWLKKILTLPVDDKELEMRRAREAESEDGDVDLSFMETREVTLKELFPDYKDDTLKAIRSKLRQVIEAPYVSEDASVSNVDEIITYLEDGKTVLIDMASLSGLHEILLSTILATKVLSKRRHMYATNRDYLEHEASSISIVMEEAQRVLGKNASPQSIFAQICNEGRKFKTG